MLHTTLRWPENFEKVSVRYPESHMNQKITTQHLLFNFFKWQCPPKKKRFAHLKQTLCSSGTEDGGGTIDETLVLIT